MLSTKRIYRLAEKYGKSLRFYPEGSEDALDEAIKECEEAEKTPEEQAAIDKARAAEQKIEQERANAERAREAAQQAQDDAEAARQEAENLKNQLAELQEQAAERGLEGLREEDYEGTDVALVKAIKNLNKKVDAKDRKIDALERKASDYEAEARKNKSTEQANTAYEELLTDLDAEYGEDCRNKAVEKFNDLIKEGKVPKGNPAKAARLMEKCYKEVKAAKKKKPDLKLDTGEGGGLPPQLKGLEIKKGSLDEVHAQYDAAMNKE